MLLTGMNYVEISRATGFDVKTVKKYIYTKDFNQLREPKSKRISNLDKYKDEIDRFLTEDKKERKKQRHSARRIFDLLKGRYEL